MSGAAGGAPLRLGVVGIGHLGRHHARILASLPGVAFAAAADLRLDRAQAAVAGTAAVAAADAAELLGRVDAVTIAVPTDAHLDVARPFLERGVHVLVEKPMAAGVAEADEMLGLAARSGALLAVGHTERFNPAIQAVRADIRRPRFIEVHRLSGFPERSLDIDVIFDVMIHDLDVLLDVAGDEVTSVEAVGVPVLTPKVDIANARLKFASGCTANITASRISRDRVRKARFFEPDLYVSVDYAAFEAEVWRLVPRDGARPSIEGGPVDVTRDEPLRAELADFVEAVRTRRAPRVDGAAGRRALALASRVAEAIEVMAPGHPDKRASARPGD